MNYSLCWISHFVSANNKILLSFAHWFKGPHILLSKGEWNYLSSCYISRIHIGWLTNTFYIKSTICVKSEVQNFLVAAQQMEVASHLHSDVDKHQMHAVVTIAWLCMCKYHTYIIIGDIVIKEAESQKCWTYFLPLHPQ